MTHKVFALDHVQLAMPAGGEDKARDFYEGVLGLGEVPKPPDLARRGGVWFESGGLNIHLGVDPKFVAATKAHPALIVEGLDALIERLRDCGYAPETADPLEGRRRAFVADPFGNRIELIEPRAISRDSPA